MARLEDSDLEIKKWNHDSSTNILEIETNQNCKQSKVYQLNIFVVYKNYGAFNEKYSQKSQM